MTATQDEHTGLQAQQEWESWRQRGHAHRNLAELAFSMKDQIAARNEALRKLQQADENIAYVSGQMAEERAKLAELEAAE